MESSSFASRQELLRGQSQHLPTETLTSRRASCRSETYFSTLARIIYAQPPLAPWWGEVPLGLVFTKSPPPWQYLGHEKEADASARLRR